MADKFGAVYAPRKAVATRMRIKTRAHSYFILHALQKIKRNGKEWATKGRRQRKGKKTGYWLDSVRGLEGNGDDMVCVWTRKECKARGSCETLVQMNGFRVSNRNSKNS